MRAHLYLLSGFLATATNAVNSNNYAGAVLPNTYDNYDQVGGSFTVPSVTPPPGAAQDGTEYRTAAWVGLDGTASNNKNGILQAGCGFRIVASDGASQVNQCWHEWYPRGPQFVDFYPSVGDTVTVVCTVTNRDNSGRSTTGTCSLQNDNTGEYLSFDMSAPSANNYVTGTSAEWIVEDPAMSGGLYPFAEFSSVQFTDCVAYGHYSGDSGYYLDGANTWYMYQNGVELAAGNIQGQSEMLVTYTG